MDGLDEQQKRDLIDNMIVHLGKNFYKGFRKYVIDKLPTSEYVKILNRMV